MKINVLLISSFLVSERVGALSLLHADGSKLSLGTDKTTLTRQHFGRRQWLTKSSTSIAAGFACAGISTALPVSPALAVPVGEGGLPDGAKQFDNVLRAQRDWAKIGKRVRSSSSSSEPLPDAEWVSISLFLRKLYAVGNDDMASMAKGIKDNESNKAKALAVASSFKEAVKAADPAIQAKDSSAFLAAQQSTAKQMDEFLALFSDVPDEL
mmetsp:Transcript_76692/g.153906  ORF Transcript_76692/g.153906 Transcript_76692/m.153906 type:complete len:211 (+) Transcript_76692:81-713(+)